MVSSRPASRDFRVLTRRRGGFDGAQMCDVQLQVAATGALYWAQTFSDDGRANAFEAQLTDDLDRLDDGEFRRKYSVPSSV